MGLKNKELFEELNKITGKPNPPKENWFKDLTHYWADDRIVKPSKK